jgi:hypothetical protein
MARDSAQKFNYALFVQLRIDDILHNFDRALGRVFLRAIGRDGVCVEAVALRPPFAPEVNGSCKCSLGTLRESLLVQPFLFGFRLVVDSLQLFVTRLDCLANVFYGGWVFRDDLRQVRFEGFNVKLCLYSFAGERVL